MKKESKTQNCKTHEHILVPPFAEDGRQKTRTPPQVDRQLYQFDLPLRRSYGDHIQLQGRFKNDHL